MIKNICKLLIMVFLLTGIVSAEEYTTVHAEHILVKTAAEAQQIKKDIDNGGSFEYYARAYSLCPSGRNGGDLGYFAVDKWCRSLKRQLLILLLEKFQILCIHSSGGI